MTVAAGILGKPSQPRVPKTDQQVQMGSNGAFEDVHARDVGGKFTSGPDANRGPQQMTGPRDGQSTGGQPMGDRGEPMGDRGQPVGRRARRPTRHGPPTSRQVSALQNLLTSRGYRVTRDGVLGEETMTALRRAQDTLGTTDTRSTVAALMRQDGKRTRRRTRSNPGGKP